MALSFLLAGRITGKLNAEELFAQYISTRHSRDLQKLIALCGNDLYHYLLRQSDERMAEDISQQCWLKVIEKHHTFRGGSSFKTWLFTVARNCLFDELRRQQRWQSCELDEDTFAPDMNADTNTIVQQLEQQQRQLLFDQQLMLLPFAQREALILQLEGFSLSEIADITSQQTETIKSRLRYARQFLQQFYGVNND